MLVEAFLYASIQVEISSKYL